VIGRVCLLTALGLASGCTPSERGPHPSEAGTAPTPVHPASPPAPAAHLELTSTAFSPGAPIPARFTADGEDVSPPMAWSAPPAGTAELALVCHDPDAPHPGGWVHWVIYAVPPSRRDLPEGVEKVEHPGNVQGAVQGKSDFDRLGWGGPSPPPGHGVHHYHFVLYALDRPTGLASGASLGELRRAMTDHILAQGELVGTYERR
jgi:Raf kinase inhibitor-like YbhB/YbcL family protein